MLQGQDRLLISRTIKALVRIPRGLIPPLYMTSHSYRVEAVLDYLGMFSNDLASKP